MKVGLHLSQDGYGYEEIQRIAIETEKIGLDSFSVLDHLHAVPRPGERQLFECWTLLSSLAVQTDAIRIGPLVLNINNRNPALLAKMGASLDRICQGRLDFGIGAGGTNRARIHKENGYEYEFDAYGISFPMDPLKRIKKLDEGLKIIKKMWVQEEASFDGDHYSIKDAMCFPKPSQKPSQKPYPPIWIGSSDGPEMMKIVARHADGWNFLGGETVEDYRNGREKLANACDRIGRDVEEIDISMKVKDLFLDFENKVKKFESAGLDLAILQLPRGKEIEHLRKLDI